MVFERCALFALRCWSGNRVAFNQTAVWHHILLVCLCFFFSLLLDGIFFWRWMCCLPPNQVVHLSRLDYPFFFPKQFVKILPQVPPTQDLLI